MEITGYIVDYKTGEKLPGATIQVTDISGSVIFNQVIANGNGYFKAKANPENALLISYVNYSPLLVLVEDAIELGTFELERAPENLPPVIVTPGKGGSMLPLLLVLVLIFFLASRSKKRRKIGSAGAVAAGALIQDKTVRIVVLGIVVVVALKLFGLFDSILGFFGLRKNPDTEQLDNESSDPGSWWNPNFYKSGPQGTLLLKADAANTMATKIYDAIGLFDDDEEAVKAVFRSLKTQSQGSYLAEKFAEKYDADLLDWLRGAGYWPKDRLSDADVKSITDLVNKLPKYFAV